MKSQEILQRLGAAEGGLIAAIRSLAHMNASDRVWPETLRKAAETLQGVQFGESLGEQRSSIEQLLRRLAEQARTAGILLDAAATLYFGRVLSRCSMECGYLADGGANSFHSGCLRIEG